MIPHDYHMHSTFSCDCKATMEEMCLAAVERGVPEIGFTEHYDLHPDEECRDWLRLEPWAEALAQVQARFEGKLIVRAGIEIGEPHLFQQEARATLARYPFDYVLGSLHRVGAGSIFDPSFYRSRPADEAWESFYLELEHMTRLGGFDVLSHFDVPIRTAFQVYGAYDPRRYERLIRPVLQNCIDHGIALDLNTKGLDTPARRLTPDLEILCWYVEMGGRRVTFGSDAHRPVRVGDGIPQAVRTAKAAGLTHATHFEKRQARLLPLL
jgi:histidinol-phosphatase (PHP family)